LYSSNFVSVIKSRMRWVGHVGEMHTKVWSEYMNDKTVREV